ncbi:MAG: DUF3846 domain-containing protein [Clostridia bacterium]|nr:DUF3846 domain-containing protein [Clostridia bacterium]
MGKGEHITGLFIEPNQSFRNIRIENELSAYQKAVGGYIECIDLPNGATIICNEEGKLNALPLNHSIKGDNGEIVDIIAGNMVIVGFNAEEGTFISLTTEQSEELKKMFCFPEMFFKYNDTIHAISIEYPLERVGTDIIFTDRRTGETAYTINCKSVDECYALLGFISNMRDEMIMNLNSAHSDIEIGSSDIGCDTANIPFDESR